MNQEVKPRDMRQHSRTEFLVIGVLALLIGVIAILSSGYVRELHISSLLEGRDNRNIAIGARNPPTDAYRQSPFIADVVVGKGETFDRLIYERADIPVSYREQTVDHFRFFVTEPSRIKVTFRLPAGESAAPRSYLYDDLYRMIDGMAATANPEPDAEGRIVLAASFEVDSGLFEIRNRFDVRKLHSINMHIEPTGAEGGNTWYKRYLERNVKEFHITLMPGQRDRLQEMRRARKYNVQHLPKGDWSERYLPSPKETVQGMVRSKNGEWAFAEIGLSGRNEQHLSDGPMTSLDVEIRAGELPYGLSAFKLYLMKSKTDGLDMQMEQFIGDTGTPAYREDLVKVFIDGEFAGYMQLWEDLEGHFFEYAQQTEGPVVGFDTDPLIANPGHSWFVPRSYYKRSIYPVAAQPDIAAPEFTERLCVDSVAKALSFGLNYSGMHGLGSDTRFYFNSRKNCYEPLYKDFNSGVSQIPDLSRRPPTRFSRHPATRGLTALSVLLPEWRPYTPTYASYWVNRTEGRKEEQNGYYWWTVTPTIMNFSLSPDFNEAFGANLFRWFSDVHKLRYSGREETLGLAERILGEPLGIREKVGYPTIETMVPASDWQHLFDLSVECTPRSRYMVDLISATGPDASVPSCKTANKLGWRNDILARWIDMPELREGLRETDRKVFVEPVSEPVTSFLFQAYAPGAADVYFIERNCEGDCSSRFWLKDDQTGEILAPTSSVIVGDRDAPVREIDVMTSNVAVDERVRIHRFRIPRLARYRFLVPQHSGDGHYLGSHGLAIPPVLSAETAAPGGEDDGFDAYFDQEAGSLVLKAGVARIDAAVRIPEGMTWKVSRDTTIEMGPGACLEVRGAIDIAADARLALEGTGSRWHGVHFLDNDRVELRNFRMSKVGFDTEIVECFGRKYTGGLSFFDTVVDAHDLTIEENHAEDGIHVLRSMADIRDSKIDATWGDAIDVDFSRVTFDGVTVHDAGTLSDSGGDSVDLSGSFAELRNLELHDSTDKGISLGENANAIVENVRISGGNYGIAIKDASRLELHDSRISDSKMGIGVYSKKPFYQFPNVPDLSDGNEFTNVEERVRIFSGVPSGDPAESGLIK